MPRLVLASASPRRRELVGRLGLEYEVMTADLDETPLVGELPTRLVLRLAQAKVEAIARRVGSGDSAIVGADTTVARRRRTFGKPIDAEDAARMLTELAGRSHRVITGVAVRPPGGGAPMVALCVSTVELRRLDPAEIADYVASGDPLDKAGAYAIQNDRFRPVRRLLGCRCNVIGLPIGVLESLLRRSGVAPALSAEAVCPGHAFDPVCCQPAGPIAARPARSADWRPG